MRRTLSRRATNSTAAVLLAVLFVYLCAYLGAVLVLQSRVNHLVATAFGVAQSHRLTGSLWPFGLGAAADDLAYADAAGATRTIARSQLILPLLTPWRLALALTGSRYADAQVDATIDRVTVGVPLYALHTAKIAAVATDVSVWPAGASQTAETALRIPRLTFTRTLRLDGHDAAAPEETDEITLAPVLLPAIPGANDGQPLTLDRLALHATAEPALPAPITHEGAAAWQAAGGTVTLDVLQLDALGTTSVLRGPVTLDETLAPAGKLTLTFTGLDKAYAALGTWHLLAPEQYEGLGNLLKLMPGAGAKPFDFPVTLRDRTLFFMDGAVFQFAPLPWQG